MGLKVLRSTLHRAPSLLSGPPKAAERRVTGRTLQARRLRVWTHALGYCARCGRLTRWPDGFALDHRIALVNGGDDAEGNTQVLCVEPNGGCHALKTTEDMAEARGERL